MPKILEKLRSVIRSRRVRWIGGGFVGCLLVLGAVGYWWVAPRVADRVVRERLSSLEERAGVAAEYQRIETSALEGIELHEFRARREGAEEPFVGFEHAKVRLSPYHLLFGNAVVVALEVRGASLTVRRHADGTTNVERMLEDLRGGDSDEEASADGDGSPGFLRYFGGEWPNATVREAELNLEAAPDARPWPVERVAAPEVSIDSSGASAAVQGRLEIAPGPGVNARWQYPNAVELEGTLRLPLASTTGTLELDRPLELVGLGPLPFLRVGVSRLEVGDGHTVEMRGISMAVQADGTPRPFGAVDRVQIALDHWPTSRRDLQIDRVTVERPKITARIDRQHGSALHDLLQLTRAPVARSVASRARRVARRAYLDIPRWKRPELDDSKSAPDAPAAGADSETSDEGLSLRERLREKLADRMRSRLIPDKFEVSGAEVHLTDLRNMGLRDASRKLGIRDGEMTLEYDPEAESVRARGGFDAYGDDSSSRGALSFDVDGRTEDGTFRSAIRVDALDLSWLSQMLGTSFANRVRGGTFDLKLETSPDGGENRHQFSGFVRLKDGRFDADFVAGDPIRDLDAGYEFEGYYTSDSPLPEPEHIRWRDLSWDDRESESSDDDTKAAQAGAAASEDRVGPAVEELDGPPEDAIYPKTGALVVESGTARLNGTEAEIRPALYGLDGMERRPARLDLEVDLERTEVQRLFEAVPKAIRGPVADAKMSGSFAWEFDVEIPLYDAGEMEWESSPKLRAFRLESLPEPVDVRELTRSFGHVIEDEETAFRRKITIPPLQPVSEKYLLENTEWTSEDLNERRQEGAFAPPGSGAAPRPWEPGQPLATVAPEDVPDGMDAVEYVESRMQNESPRPERQGPGSKGETESSGSDGTPDARRFDSTMLVQKHGMRRVHPYGPYIYVPLHHVTKWLPRAVMTTEDNSFFEHDGFNWFALENSLEENIEAGGFVRGGSTVSMQLVKNLYLSFDKVLARKLREAYLVWLMENVVDVPKPRILELYFNIIEFGPGVYGIHDASVHYFGKRPDQLSLTEAVFLVSVVPNPKKHHRFYERGEIPDSWFDSIMTYVEIMQDRDRATEEDVERARSDRPTFYKPAPGEPKLRPSTREETESSAPSFDDLSNIFQSSSSEESR